MNVLGVDIGQEGGIAIINIEPDSMATVTLVARMPVVGKDIDVQYFVGEIPHWKLDLCVIERTQSMPKQGITGAFNYGKMSGMFEGMIAALKVPYKLVRPQEWKKLILKGTKKKKADAINHCKHTYPDVILKGPRARRDHDGMADAICIAEWGIRTSPSVNILDMTKKSNSSKPKLIRRNR